MEDTRAYSSDELLLIINRCRNRLKSRGIKTSFKVNLK